MANLYRVQYCFEDARTKKATTHPVIEIVKANASDETSIKAVLVTNQSRTHSSDVLRILHVANMEQNVLE